MSPLRVSTLLLVALGSGCRGTGTGPPLPLTQAQEREAAQRHLRRMFPGIEGEITPEAIAGELARERTEREPGSVVRRAASEAIERSDFHRARELLGELLAGEHVEKARELAASGDAAGALAALDQALLMAPRSATIACLHGEAVLALSKTSAERPGTLNLDPALLESALASFLRVARGDAGPDETAADLRVRAWLGAGRAAAALGRGERAREYAQSGLDAAASSSDAGRFDVPLRRTLAQASFDVYLGALPGGATADSVRERAAESRDALYGLLGRTPEDPWTWKRLAEVSRSQGAPAEAYDLALRGLSIAPDDPDLLEDFSLSARALGGPRAVVEALEPFCRRHPDVARVAAQLAEARFELARASARNGADPRAELAAAEAGFARARALDPELEDRSRDFEARCRGALGLWLLDRGDAPGARDAFMRMEDVRPGGLALEIDAGAGRGSDGLFRVAQAYAERGDSLEQAALIQDLLHAADPQDARYAFGAGHANREAAVALELHASGLVRASLVERNRLLEHARELMERAFRALDDAAKLAPEDVRVHAEAGAVLVRYLQRDPERGRAFLERAVLLGEAEVRALAARADGQAADRLALEEAQTRVGDACLDLGVLHLALLGDPARALEWLEKSRTAGPDPGPEIEGLLERCRAALAGEIDPRIREEDRWAAPIRPGKGP
ncbi:MAG: hypothetical protein ACKVXR_13470 [Planctomycetota bacterium]